MLMMYTGDAIAVEDLTVGTILMGDDHTPRVIDRLHNYPSNDTAQYTCKMYTVTPRTSNIGGRVYQTVRGANNAKRIQPLTVSHDQPIVFRIGHLPGKVRQGKHHGKNRWILDYADLNTAGVPMNKRRYFDSQDAAQQERQQTVPRIAALTFTLGAARIDEIKADPSHAAKMFRPTRPIRYGLPENNTMSVLLAPGFLPTEIREQAQQEILEYDDTASYNELLIVQLVRAAMWTIGLWLVDGTTGAPYITQGGPPRGQSKSHADIMELCEDIALMFGGVYRRGPPKYTDKSINPGYDMQFHAYGSPYSTSFLYKLLNEYGIYNNKHIPDRLLKESVEIRRWLLGGLIDGDGHWDGEKGQYEISCKYKSVIETYTQLIGSLGLNIGKTEEMTIVNEESGVEYHGYRIRFSGRNLIKLNDMIRLEYKHNDAFTRKFDDHHWCIKASDMEGEGIPYGFTFPGDQQHFLFADKVGTLICMNVH